MEKELIFEGKENTSSVNIKEFSQKGAMLDITLTGKISGKIAGLISCPKKLRNRHSKQIRLDTVYSRTQ